MKTTRVARPAERPGTANDALKERFGSWFWGSLAAAAGIHFVLLAFAPRISVAAMGIEGRQIDAIEIPKEFEIPPPPAEPQRPAVPTLSHDVDLDPDLTIAPVTFSENPSADLPDPPAGGGVDVSEQPVWTPHEVAPEFRNTAEYLRALEHRYPPMLRDAGIGGTVVLWVFIDETGQVVNTRVTASSGSSELDRVAEELMQEVARFRPALNRDRRVGVWIQIPVKFEAR